MELLVNGIVIETKGHEEGRRYPAARVVYRFERPAVSETPIPIEMEPLFGQLAENWQTHQAVL